VDNHRERFEFKYLVPAALLTDLRRAIAPFVEADPHARDQAGRYTVHSIYFDTRGFDYYDEKLSGLKNRKKVRVRGYDEQKAGSPVVLEIKRKNGMAVTKSRAWLPYSSLEALFAAGDVERYVGPHARDPEELEDARRFFYHVHRRGLRPVILIHYEREAFFYRFDPTVRITFDKNLRSAPSPALADLFGEGRALPSLSGRFVLELKLQQGIPSWLKSILENFGLERTSVSKYTICLDEHGLPTRPAQGAAEFPSRRPRSNGGQTTQGNLDAIPTVLALKQSTAR
jgi:hypothetical protein